MKQYFLPLILALTTIVASDPFLEYTEGTVVGVASHSPTQNWVVQINSYTNHNIATYPPGQWHTVDMSAWLPADTKAVFINTVSIITHGNEDAPCGVHLYIRNFNDTLIEWGPASQAGTQHPGDGIRHAYTDWVSVTNGKFDFKWVAIRGGGQMPVLMSPQSPSDPPQQQWPAYCAYGLAVRVSAYVR